MHPLASAILAAPAIAGCPTGDNMADGIVLAQNQPFFMRGGFQATEQGFAERRVVESGVQVRESMSLYAHALVMTGEPSAAGDVEFTHVDDITPLESLPDEGMVSINRIAKGPLGDTYVGLELTFHAHGSIALAECGYDARVVTSTLRDRDGVGASFRLDYAPELDLVLAARRLEDDGTETPAHAYQWAGTAADVAR